MKKLLVSSLALLMLAGCAAPAECPECPEPQVVEVEKTPEPLPAPRDTTKTYVPSEGADPVACEENVYSAACSSIGVDNLVNYLNRDDVVYIDLRDYKDYAKKHLKNFEVIPYFAVVFDKEAGTEGKPQLYGGELTAPVATYQESALLMESFIPKDKTVFLMCQSGGRVAQMMTLLDSLGYDMSKIYNVGGMGNFTDSAFAEWTTDMAEMVVDATYNFEGLTLAK